MISLNVDNIETTLALINANEGKTVRQNTKIEVVKMGYFAQFTYCEGNTIGLYAAK